VADRADINRPDDGGADGRDRNADSYLGGADAVEKTTYASDVRGADVEDREEHGRLTATVPHQRGLGSVGWVAMVLALLALLAYAAGLFL
jgi:hypothetical protein